MSHHISFWLETHNYLLSKIHSPYNEIEDTTRSPPPVCSKSDCSDLISLPDSFHTHLFPWLIPHWPLWLFCFLPQSLPPSLFLSLQLPACIPPFLSLSSAFFLPFVPSSTPPSFLLFLLSFSFISFLRPVLGSRQNYGGGTENSVYSLPKHLHSHYQHLPA